MWHESNSFVPYGAEYTEFSYKMPALPGIVFSAYRSNSTDKTGFFYLPQQVLPSFIIQSTLEPQRNLVMWLI